MQERAYRTSIAIAQICAAVGITTSRLELIKSRAQSPVFASDFALAAKGYDKAQAVRHLREEVGSEPEIIFFGDRTEAPGNDYGIVRALDEAPEPSQWHAVKQWADTMSILRDSYSD